MALIILYQVETLVEVEEVQELQTLVVVLGDIIIQEETLVVEVVLGDIIIQEETLVV